MDKAFSIKGDKKEIYLFNISSGKKYLLNKGQFNILKKLDGSKTKSEILNRSNTSNSLIDHFINNLEKLKAVEYLDSKTRNPRKDIINLTKWPRLKEVHWELTSKCNLRCLHCYQVSYLYKYKEIPLNRIKAVIKEMVKLGTEKVSISGGEPLMREDLLEILTELENNNIRISAIFTNGTLISNEILDKLKLLKSNVNLNISLDGIKPSSMILRGLKESKPQKIFLNMLIKNIKLALMRGFSIRINTILNKHNIDSIEEMYDFLNKEMVGIFWSIGFPRSLGSCVYNKDELLIEWEEIFKTSESLIKKHLQYLQRNKANIELKVQYLFHKKFFNNLNYYNSNSFICNYDDKHSMCCIKPNGDVLPCPVLLNFKIGNIFQEELGVIWKSKRMRQIKDMRIKDLTSCKKCKHSSLCGGGCRASAYVNCKSLYREDPLACSTMKHFESSIKFLLLNYAENKK